MGQFDLVRSHCSKGTRSQGGGPPPESAAWLPSPSGPSTKLCAWGEEEAVRIVEDLCYEMQRAVD
jgi:hypothetical protein